MCQVVQELVLRYPDSLRRYLGKLQSRQKLAFVFVALVELLHTSKVLVQLLLQFRHTLGFRGELGRGFARQRCFALRRR